MGVGFVDGNIIRTATSARKKCGVIYLVVPALAMCLSCLSRCAPHNDVSVND